ncbi:hypothetical protein ACFL6M_00950 [Candidatus Eisenbacteria bacterium]|uniref:Bacterial repeat domain-containing protein n=1 Tax=Eiseniibacteriota bacterium TaxID=2212470 RepID=A0ABV6YII5_UNCEI
MEFSGWSGDIAEVETQTGTGIVHFCCDIRPFVTGGTNNSNIVFLSQGSALVSEMGSSNLGVQFRHDGLVYARSADHALLGSYTLNEWCHVAITLDTDTDLFDLEVSGPGIDGVLSATNLPFEENLDEVNYIMIYDDSLPPNDLGLDNVCLSTASPTPMQRTTWGQVKSSYR